MFFFTVFCALFATIAEVRSVNRSYFTAAVVEYFPIDNTGMAGETSIQKNLEVYTDILEGIQQKLDIIVFPESALLGLDPLTTREYFIEYSLEIPDEINGVSLCPKDPKQAKHLGTIACAAKTFNTYILFNVVERSVCTAEGCAKDGWNIYNVNVILDRNGALVAKYRKYNLFLKYEGLKNVTATPEIVTFTTDFGVTFGTFTCFDLLFPKPAIEMIKKHGITHVVFTTNWFSILPFLTAVQAQQQWAYEFDVVFLASSRSEPLSSSGGGGIYQGKFGALTMGVSAEGQTTVYLANVTSNVSEIVIGENSNVNENEIDKAAKEMDSFLIIPDVGSIVKVSSLITVNQKKAQEVLCHGDLCCHFDVDMEWNDAILNENKYFYRYRMIAFTGNIAIPETYDLGLEVCSIITCLDDSLTTCNRRFKNYDDVSWPVRFKNISARANFANTERKIQFPSTLVSSLRPFSPSHFEWTRRYFQNDTLVEKTIRLKQPQNRLMTFGIFGRDFDGDRPFGKNNSGLLTWSLQLIVALVFLNYFLV